jgi:VNT family MFS transporter (synaptic vesicle glycoprotein 2)
MCQYPKERPTGEVSDVDQLPDLEEAIKKCKIGKYNYVLIAVSGCLMTCAFVELTSINVIFPVAQCDLNLTTADKGILGSIGYVGVILSSHLWGFLSDTRGRRTILIPTLLVAFLMTFLSSLVNNFWLMLIFRFLNGFL